MVYFTIPEFLVYAVVELSLQPGSRDAP